MNKKEPFDSEYEPKLCVLSNPRSQTDLDLIKRLAQDSRYICIGCGRTAANEENLCVPQEL